MCYSSEPAPASAFPFDHTFVSAADLERRYPDAKAIEIPKEMRKDVLPTSVSSLVYTSGSTGKPKAAILNSQRQLTLIHFHFANAFRATDRIYAVGALFHANGAFEGSKSESMVDHVAFAARLGLTGGLALHLS